MIENKPEWKDAPKWANYLAMDGDGQWFWYEKQPTWDNSRKEWWGGDDCMVSDVEGAKASGSLEERPTRKYDSAKPSWNDAPEWANWLAMDLDGGKMVLV